MYNFVDTIEASEGVVLPSEALMINGQYIEDQISGYRTLSVQGREALSPDVESYETGVRDGSRLKNKRYPERIIIVQYQLIADSNEAFREAYNQLGRILDVTEAQLIFNDEQDKFYIGTPCIIGAVPPGKNAVVGTFEILCTDPFKYSVVEYEATPDMDDGSVMIDYQGTYKSFPILEADFYEEAEDGETAKELTGAGDCGYVAFFTEDEKIIQLGDPDEADIEDGFEKSQTMMNQTFMGDTAWGTTAKALWAVNSGTTYPSGKVQQMGTVAMAASGTETNTYSKSSSKTLLSSASAGMFKYTVKGVTSKRTKNSVYVTATVTVQNVLAKDEGTLQLVFVIGGYSKAASIKVTKDWKPTTSKSVDIGISISGLTTSKTTLAGIKLNVSDPVSDVVKSFSCEDLTVNALNSSTEVTGYYLKASSYGTADKTWHGPSITRQVGADAAGDVGAANFTFTYRHKLCIGQGSKAKDQKGAFQMVLTTDAGAVVAGVRIIKSESGKKGNMVFYVNGKEVNSTPIDLHYNNYYFGSDEDSVQTTTITKAGGTVTFAVGDYKRQYYVDTLTETKVTKVTFTFEQYSALTALEYNGLYWAKFVKNNCDTWMDIPNKFSANDVVEADCKTGEIRLNGIPTPNLGALGNDWEGFYLVHGVNQIGISYSNWVEAEYAPVMKVRYREVFL